MTKFTQTYPTDLKYTEWLLLVGFFPDNPMGRPRKWELWQIINAILYVVHTGLPIAKALVDAMGGDIKVESELGKGSTVVLQFHAG